MADANKVKPPIGIGSKYIEMVFDADGTTKIEAHGFTDGTCRAATKSVEDALGRVQKRTVKNQACAKQTVKARK